MRRVFHCLVVVSLCALLSGVAAAQGKEIPKAKAGGVSAGGGSQCDAVAGNLVANCGFETGMFEPEWTLSGDIDMCTGIAPGPPVAHSGNFGAFLGPIGDLGFMAQFLTTKAGQNYDISFWLRNFDRANEFQVYWDGQLISDQVDLPDFDYTQMTLPDNMASTDSTELKIGFRNDPDFLWLDDIVVVPSLAQPK